MIHCLVKDLVSFGCASTAVQSWNLDSPRNFRLILMSSMCLNGFFYELGPVLLLVECLHVVPGVQSAARLPAENRLARLSNSHEMLGKNKSQHPTTSGGGTITSCQVKSQITTLTPPKTCWTKRIPVLQGFQLTERTRLSSKEKICCKLLKTTKKGRSKFRLCLRSKLLHGRHCQYKNQLM